MVAVLLAARSHARTPASSISATLVRRDAFFELHPHPTQVILHRLVVRPPARRTRSPPVARRPPGVQRRIARPRNLSAFHGTWRSTSMAPSSRYCRTDVVVLRGKSTSRTPGSSSQRAHGVRRTYRFAPGTDFDRTLSGTAGRGRGVDDRSRHRGRPAARRDNGGHRARDVPGAVPRLLVDRASQTQLARISEWNYAADRGRRSDLRSRQHEGADRESQPADTAAGMRGVLPPPGLRDP
jgi:hypothetical protein